MEAIILRTKEQLRNFIAAGGKTTFNFKQNKRKRMPARKVVVTPSPWGNYCVSGYIDEKIMWCENGLSLDSAVCTVMAAARGK